ncbi:MAG: MFS transporter, partial [Cyanobacteria bacterium P01_H01_bin.58]
TLLVLALARRTPTFLGGALFGGFFSPLSGSCGSALWRSQVPPEVQGRVFAARYLITQLSTTLGTAIAGPLADYVFEPAMQPGMPLTKALGQLFGSGVGAGMAVQIGLFASLGIATTLGGYSIPRLRRIDDQKRIPI